MWHALNIDLKPKILIYKFQESWLQYDDEESQLFTTTVYDRWKGNLVASNIQRDDFVHVVDHLSILGNLSFIKDGSVGCPLNAQIVKKNLLRRMDCWDMYENIYACVPVIQLAQIPLYKWTLNANKIISRIIVVVIEKLFHLSGHWKERSYDHTDLYGMVWTLIFSYYTIVDCISNLWELLTHELRKLRWRMVTIQWCDAMIS